MRKTRFFLGIAVCFALLSSCKQKSTLDLKMQKSVADLVESEMKSSNLDSVVVLMMSTSTGEIHVKTKMVNDPATGTYIVVPEAQMDEPIEPGSTIVPFTVMAAMEEDGSKLEDVVDTGYGELAINGITIKDDITNGYGLINLSRCVTIPSYVGLVQVLDYAFKSNVPAFVSRMKSMSFGAPDDKTPFDGIAEYPSMLNDFTLGYSFKMSPTQILTAWNGIANYGRILAPSYFVGDSTLVNPKMSSAETLSAMRELLIRNGASTSKSSVGLGYLSSAHTKLTDDRMIVNASSCGFYPAENPKYTCLVFVYRTESLQAEKGKVKSEMQDVARKIFYGLAVI